MSTTLERQAMDVLSELGYGYVETQLARIANGWNREVHPTTARLLHNRGLVTSRFRAGARLTPLGRAALDEAKAHKGRP